LLEKPFINLNFQAVNFTLLLQQQSLLLLLS